MPTKIQLRRDTLQNWNSIKPILLQGEIGIITDTEPYKFRIGDGVKTFDQLEDSNTTLTATEIRDLLAGLTGDNRLDASAIKNLPGGSGGSETSETIKTKLEALKTTQNGIVLDLTNAKDDITLLKSDNTTNKTNIATLQTQAEGINPLPISQCWVSTSGLDTNNGGINKPFRTIQKALDMSFGVINVLPGTYTESLNIPIAYGQYGPVIQGYGTTEAPKAEIRGTLTIPSTVSRIRIKDLQLDGKGEGSAIVDNGSDGRHIMEDVTLANAGVGNAVITVINGKNWWTVTGSAIEGAIHLTGTPTTGANFNIAYSPNSYLCTPIIDANYIFTAFCVGKLGYITHSNGSVYCSKVGSWYPFNNKIINSTSTNPTNVISVGYSTFSADGISFGTISTAGSTVITNYNIDSLYQDVCLSAISTVASTLITTTASTLIAGTKKVERNISYNTSNGELTFTKTGSYNITAVVKIDCTEWNKKVETWIEKWNTSTSTWDAVADTGMQRMFQTDQEVEINYHFASYFIAGEKYRIRAISDSDTTISTKTITLGNNVKMPAIRLSIYA